MMRLLLLALTLLAGAAQAAAPGGSCAFNRTSGVVPLGITVDCSGITGGTKPFHNNSYQISWGDTANGSDPVSSGWIYGAAVGMSKNMAFTPEAGHTYQTAGSYTVTIRVCNSSSECLTQTQAITASAFSGTTWCITSASSVSGCTGTAKANETDFDDVLSRCLAVGAPIRCRFDAAGTYTASTSGAVNLAGVVRIDSYGSGSGPTINSTNVSGVINFTSSNASNDVAISDLKINGASAADTGKCVTMNGSVTNLTILRVTCANILGMVLSAGGGPWEVCTGCVVQDSVSPNGLFFRGIQSAVIGSSFGPSNATAEHSARIQRCQKCAFHNNTFLETADSTKQTFTLRADVHATSTEDTTYTVVAFNKMTTSTAQVLGMTIAPSADSEDGRISDVIWSKNWIVYGFTGAGGTMLGLRSGTNVTLSNNVVEANVSATSNKNMFVVQEAVGSVYPVPDATVTLNNTFYDGLGTGTDLAITLGANVTNQVVKNNLCYFPAAGGSSKCLSDAASGTTKSNNTNDAGGASPNVATNPTFSNAASPPQGLAITTASTYKNAGTETATYPAIKSDFNQCADKNGNNRIGAFVPRADAICVGAP